jgi:hypothetical protein
MDSRDSSGGPKGGSMQCAAASPKQTLCLDRRRRGAPLTPARPIAAGSGKMRVALEPTTTS